MRTGIMKKQSIITMATVIILFPCVVLTNHKHLTNNSNNIQKINILLILDISLSPWQGDSQLIQEYIQTFFDVLSEYENFNAGIFTADNDINKYNLTSEKKNWKVWGNSNAYKCKDVKYSKFYKAIYEGINVVGKNGIIVAISDWGANKDKDNEPHLEYVDYDIDTIVVEYQAYEIDFFPILINKKNGSSDLGKLVINLENPIVDIKSNNLRSVYQGIIKKINDTSTSLNQKTIDHIIDKKSKDIDHIIDKKSKDIDHINDKNPKNIDQINDTTLNNQQKRVNLKHMFRQFFEFIFFSFIFWIIIFLCILSFFLILYFKKGDDIKVYLDDGDDQFCIKENGIYMVGREDTNNIENTNKIIIGTHLFRDKKKIFSGKYNIHLVSRKHGKFEWNGKELVLHPPDKPKNHMWLAKTKNTQPSIEITEPKIIEDGNCIWLVWDEKHDASELPLKLFVHIDSSITDKKGTFIRPNITNTSYILVSYNF